MDEFPPKFGQSRYVAVVPETSPPGTSVIQLTASDQDDSKTNYIYQELSGDPKGNLYLTTFTECSVG